MLNGTYMDRLQEEIATQNYAFLQTVILKGKLHIQIRHGHLNAINHLERDAFQNIGALFL